MKTILRITSYFLVLVVGIAAGYYVGFGSGKGVGFAHDMVETAYYSAYVEMQMSEGTDATQVGQEGLSYSRLCPLPDSPLPSTF